MAKWDYVGTVGEMLHAEMIRNDLTVEEVVQGMHNFANEKEFNKDIDLLFNNGILVEDEWDIWSDGDMR